MKPVWLLLSVLLFGITVNANGEPKELYAQSAVMMDADSGRVLFEKNGYEKKAMASTTKIMTCILALERGNLKEPVEASKNAAGQPKVHLGVYEGEQFYLRDLLYSLMLESHNDSAVMIAEHLAGTVEKFADIMNEKAVEIGCTDTYFITPNGLDAVDEKGKHSTTAENLAKIMSYCITKSPKKEEFLKITGQKNYSFSDIGGKRNFSCFNHNAFLQMMEGAVSGKTGFTGDAGYCYVGALKRDDRTFVVALLGCGWPNNKTYKWADTKKLMNYGLDNFRYYDIGEIADLKAKPIKNGIPESSRIGDTGEVRFKVKQKAGGADRVLLKKDEAVETDIELKRKWKAPIKKGEHAGKVLYRVGDEILREDEIVTDNRVEEITYSWCVGKVIGKYVDI